MPQNIAMVDCGSDGDNKSNMTRHRHGQ